MPTWVYAGRVRPAECTDVFMLRGGSRQSLAATLERIAVIAPRIAHSELRNLARHLARETAAAGREVRVGMIARSQGELAERAAHAARLVRGLRGGPMVSDGGVHAACGGGGRAVLVFPGGAGTSGTAGGNAAAVLARSLGVARWLERLGVRVTAAVGHGLGEIAGLVWAGSLSEPEAARLMAQYGAVRSGLAAPRTATARVAADEATVRMLTSWCGLAIAAFDGPCSYVLAGPAAAVRALIRRAATLGVTAEVVDGGQALHTPAMAPCAAALRSVLGQVRFAPPRRRLVSTVTARELAPGDDPAALLCTQLTSPVRFGEALRVAADGADLIMVAGADEALTAAATACGVPSVGLAAGVRPAGGRVMVAAGPRNTGPVDGAPARGGPAAGAPVGRGEAACAAALFAAGAVADATALAPGPAEPVDIWSDWRGPARAASVPAIPCVTAGRDGARPPASRPADVHALAPEAQPAGITA